MTSNLINYWAYKAQEQANFEQARHNKKSEALNEWNLKLTEANQKATQNIERIKLETQERLANLTQATQLKVANINANVQKLIAANNLSESIRSHKTEEEETERMHKQNESETYRHNTAMEKLESSKTSQNTGTSIFSTLSLLTGTLVGAGLKFAIDKKKIKKGIK